MNKKIITLLVLTDFLAFPVVGFAIPLMNPPGVYLNFHAIFGAIFGFIWPVFAGLAVVMFVVGAFLFLTSQGDPGKVKNARDAVIWGVVGVIVALLSLSIPILIRSFF